jgi:hypothetical protein
VIKWVYEVFEKDRNYDDGIDWEGKRVHYYSKAQSENIETFYQECKAGEKQLGEKESIIKETKFQYRVYGKTLEAGIESTWFQENVTD